VTGVLLVGLGKATRLMEYMLASNKEYVALLYLHQAVEENTIRKTFTEFTGEIMQLPPVVSAVKRQERKRRIYYQNILDVKDNQYVLFRVGCQHGTYIRKLCSDMAEHMGVSGQMQELRRTKAGPLTEDDGAIDLDTLRNLWELYRECEGNEAQEIEKRLRNYLRPMEDLLGDFSKVYARDSAVDSLCYGSDLAIPGVAKLDEGIEMGDTVAVMTQKGELIAMGIAYLSSEGVMKKNKGAFVKTNKVFMEPGSYPQYWEFVSENDS
jgi:H/ACA ribonucleoprotein complex subunit 4